MSNCSKISEATPTPYNLGLPHNLRYLVIDIGQKHSPIFPPNEEYSFHVLFLEPLIKIASNFVDASPGRMTVLACAVGCSPGVKSFTQLTELAPAAALMSFEPKRAKSASSQRSVSVPQLPLDDLVAAVPKGAEIFVRVDEQNLSLAEAERSIKALERVSLFKKKILLSDEGEAGKNGDMENKYEMNRWIALMRGIGFRLVKIDVIERLTNVIGGVLVLYFNVRFLFDFFVSDIMNG